jgi:uncharacterized membrane protein (DUF4010 family)
MDLTNVTIPNWPFDISLSRIGLALGLGFLIGLERERAGKDVGVRTFSFTCMLGALGWMITPLVGMATLLFVVLMTVVINAQSLMRNKTTVVTTSVTLFLTALIGIVVGEGQTLVPTAATFFIVALLSWKEALVSFSTALTRLEIRSAITLGILAFVIYPLLPVGFIDPWKIIDLRSTWLTVILISAIGFGNYILLRLYGTRGVAYTGFLGGLVSSSVTVTELAGTVRRSGSEMRQHALKGMRLANVAMFLRNGVVLALLAPVALLYPLLPMAAMMGLSAWLAFRKTREIKPVRPIPEINSYQLNLAFSPAKGRTLLWPAVPEPKSNASAIGDGEPEKKLRTVVLERPEPEKQAQAEAKETQKPLNLALSSPFSLKSALKYGCIFLAITILSEIGQRVAGVAGFYVVSFLSGFVSSASASATAATQAVQGKITMPEAGVAVLLASAASGLVQIVLADRISGDRALTRRLALESGLVFAVGALALGAQLVLQASGLFNPDTVLQFLG